MIQMTESEKRCRTILSSFFLQHYIAVAARLENVRTHGKLNSTVNIDLQSPTLFNGRTPSFCRGLHTSIQGSPFWFSAIP